MRTPDMPNHLTSERRAKRWPDYESRYRESLAATSGHLTSEELRLATRNLYRLSQTPRLLGEGDGKRWKVRDLRQHAEYAMRYMEEQKARDIRRSVQGERTVAAKRRRKEEKAAMPVQVDVQSWAREHLPNLRPPTRSRKNPSEDVVARFRQRMGLACAASAKSCPTVAETTLVAAASNAWTKAKRAKTVPLNELKDVTLQDYAQKARKEAERHKVLRLRRKGGEATTASSHLSSGAGMPVAEHPATEHLRERG